MADLKSCLESAGYSNVKTYIQSGNVIFESDERNVEKLTNEIEELLSKEFNYESKVVIRTHEQVKKIIENAPKWWGESKDFRHNLLFIKEPMTAVEALKQSGEPKGKIEFAKAGEGVIYVSASIQDITRSNFVRLPSKPIYKQMTIRNYNTSVKLLELMGQ
jgi:uncharacterized protein (DUF1697 family)